MPIASFAHSLKMAFGAVLLWGALLPRSAVCDTLATFEVAGTFIDQGTYSGSFTYDTDTRGITDWHVTTAGGSNNFSGYTYTPSTSNVTLVSFENASTGVPELGLTFNIQNITTFEDHGLQLVFYQGVLDGKSLVDDILNSNEGYHVPNSTLSFKRVVSTFNGSPKWDTAPPVILALDGVDGPYIKWLGIRPSYKIQNYLAPALRSAWGYPPDDAVDIQTVDWLGSLTDAGQLNSYIQLTREIIPDILHKYPDRPLVIFAHSWGTVVAYQVLSELGVLGGTTNSVAAFITTGSPLALHSWCSTIIKRLIRKVFDPLQGQYFVFANSLAKPRVVDIWQNYFILRDCISSKKSFLPIFQIAIKSNIQFRVPWNTGPGTAHGEYFQNSNFLTTELSNIRVILNNVCAVSTPNWTCKPGSAMKARKIIK